MKKQLGKLYPDRRHPDLKRDRLNLKGMRKLRRLESKPGVETYLRDAHPVQIIVRAVLMSWKWKLSLISPGGPAKRWQMVLDQRYGKVRLMVLRRNVSRS